MELQHFNAVVLGYLAILLHLQLKYFVMNNNIVVQKADFLYTYVM